MTADTSLPSHSSRPTTVVLLRTPIPPAQGTDPYHDAFGSFCLPSFPMSALDSGAATPLALPPKVLPPAMSMISEALGGTAQAQAQAQQGQQGPRPEELLLGALQKQKQDNARGCGRASSPQRNYTRQQAAYDGPPAAATASSSSASSSSMTLTTHHIAADPQREWCIVSLPVLGSRSTNHEAFDGLLLNGEWSGVVATSNRAWDAWKEATLRCAASGEQPKTNYATTPFFLISARSAANFRNEKTKGVPEGWAPAPTKVYGAPNTAKGSKGPAAGDDDGDSGKGSAGEALGQYILNWLQYQAPPVASKSDGNGEAAPPPPARKPLLILQGDKSLPALTSLLTERDTPFKTCVVYETCADSGIAKSLGGVQTLLADLTWTSRIAGGASPKPLQRAVLRSASGAMDGDGDDSEVLSEAGPSDRDDAALCPDWLVFFSPSGVDFTAEELRRRKWLPPPPPAPPPPTEEASADVAAASSTSQRPRILAIGPTTAAHLQEKYGLHDVVVAEKPEPAGVREGILKAEGGDS